MSEEKKKPAAKKAKAIKVAPGKSVTSKRGILGEGSKDITAECFCGGDKAVKNLLKLGVLIEE